MKLTPITVTQCRDLKNNASSHSVHFTVEGWGGVGSALYTDTGKVSWITPARAMIATADEDRTIAEAGREVIAKHYPDRDPMFYYVDLIEDALANLEGAWPTDDDDRLLPCGACVHRPVSEALRGASPVHVYHRGEAAFGALLDHEWQGRTERLWLGRLHVGTAATHPSGDIYVHAFNEAPVVVQRERDILPALMTQWGYTEAGAA